MIKKSCRILGKGSMIGCAVFCSDEVDPGVISGCECLGTIEIPYPENFNELEDRYSIRFYFGNTTIRVTISTKGKEYVDEEVQIKYSFNIGVVDAIG